jgi:23S rRNA (uracil1939-C5)-methyltransferase
MKKYANEILTIQENLTHDGRGITHAHNKTVFVDNALPGETVEVQFIRGNKTIEEGVAVNIIDASADRVSAPCSYTTRCGGCSLQHVNPTAQITHKEAFVAALLKNTAGIEAVEWMLPITAPTLGYRTKARLGVKYVEKKGVLVGFREPYSPFLADMDACLVLDPQVSALIPPLKSLINTLDAKRTISQIEVAVGNEGVGLVFRHLEALSASDEDALKGFGQTHQALIYLQSKGPDTIHLVEGKHFFLSYDLPRYNIRLFFHPTGFTQVNRPINEKMVDKALDLLALSKTDRVLDLFCGMGNFTLPIARHAAFVLGVEGDAALIARAKENAMHNQIENVDFKVADLSVGFETAPFLQEHFDKILLDPARLGAKEIIPYLPTLGAQKIVYVSCNPSTLVRDIALLQEQGYRLQKIGLLDMFPHTSHVECIALFERI